MNGYGFHWSRCHGNGPAPLVGVVAAVLLAIAILEWIIARIWWLIGGTVLFLAAVAAILIAVLRWTERREARFAERRRAELAALAAAERRAVTAQVIPQVAPAAQPAIEQHVHYHVHVGERDSAAARAMLPGTAGER